VLCQWTHGLAPDRARLVDVGGQQDLVLGARNTVSPMTFRACAVCSGVVFIHVAAALDDFGGVLDTGKFSADRAGYAELIDWASRLGHIVTFAIEGTGSYGAGLVAAVRRSGIGVVEVMRTDRRDRRLRAKSDCLDAENAARAVLSGHANATPKTNDGTVEMIRQIKVAKDVALKARTAAMISLKTVIVNAPDELREQLQPLSKMALIRRCASLRPTDIATVEAATTYTLRSIAPGSGAGTSYARSSSGSR
jgi:transposase